ncbi:MAG: asparaginase, partial [Hyphomicrobiales bacterium]|nr:asparaginase [Hyphomicrobiales bacterium]
MADPVLVEITRGRLVESRHAGAIAVASADGALILRIGDIDRPVYPRSAIKSWQAIPLVATGAADRFGFGEAELALACASHNGERRHVQTALGMLRAAEATEADLECGAHWPRLEADQATLHRQSREPGAIYNNCSGKHA